MKRFTMPLLLSGLALCTQPALAAGKRTSTVS